MKFFNFYNTEKDVREVLTDKNLKKWIRVKLSYENGLYLGIEDEDESLISYLLLQYHDMIVPLRDFSPVRGVDYIFDPEVKSNTETK